MDATRLQETHHETLKPFLPYTTTAQVSALSEVATLQANRKAPGGKSTPARAFAQCCT